MSAERLPELGSNASPLLKKTGSAGAADLNVRYGRGAMTRVFSAIVAAGKASTARMFACHHCSASREVQAPANAHPARAWSRASALGGRWSGDLARHCMMRSARSADTGWRDALGRVRRRLLDLPGEQAFDGVIVEQRLAGEQPVANGSQRVKVAAAVNALRPFDRLRRHEVRRADDRIGLPCRRRIPGSPPSPARSRGLSPGRTRRPAG